MSTNHNLNHTIDVTLSSSPSYGHQIPYSPKYSAAVSIMPSWKGYGLAVNGVYSGVRYTLSENIVANKLDPYLDINLGAEKELDFEKTSLWASAKVMNLLGKNYEVIRSFPMPGRYYQITLKFKYK
jgi:outer membrane cobalamin receptor